jgi:hypothetical protein
MRRLFAAVVAAAALQMSPPLLSAAAADPVPRVTIPTELLSPATVTTDGGSVARLDAGDWLVPKTYRDDWDAEMRRLQDQETRLEAENESLKKSLRATDPKWYWLVGAFVSGLTIKYGYDEVKGRF